MYTVGRVCQLNGLFSKSGVCVSVWGWGVWLEGELEGVFSSLKSRIWVSKIVVWKGGHACLEMG